MIGHCSWDRDQGVQILEDPPFAPSAKTKTALSAKDGAPSLSSGVEKPINRYTRKGGPPAHPFVSCGTQERSLGHPASSRFRRIPPNSGELSSFLSLRVPIVGTSFPIPPYLSDRLSAC